MADESNVLPTSRIVLAVALYFRDARTLPPLTAPATAPVDQPPN